MSAEAPSRIRVEQDAEGFWTCREAVSGSQEYVRADLVDGLINALTASRRIIQQLITDEYNTETWGLKQRIAVIDGAIARAERP